MKKRSLNELRQVKDTVYNHPYNSRTTYSNEEIRSIAIEFNKWMKKNDTPENAERWFGFTDNDMFDAFIDEQWDYRKSKDNKNG